MRVNQFHKKRDIKDHMKGRNQYYQHQKIQVKYHQKKLQVVNHNYIQINHNIDMNMFYI